MTTTDLASPVSLLHFIHCSIPYIDRDARIPTTALVINNTVVPYYGLDVEVQLKDSIYNAVSAFQPARLCISNCDDLPDAFFEWLGEDDDHVEAKALSTLDIQYCRWFTSRGLCNFVQTRSAQSKKYGVGLVSPIKKLLVRGEEYHSLAKEDVQWFRAAKDEIDVDWLVDIPEDDGEEYVNMFNTKDRQTT